MASQLSVQEALERMASAVQSANFGLAETIGTQAPIPLSIPKSSIKLLEPISEGAQATVCTAEYNNDIVAVKKGIIREHVDLVRLRREVIFLEDLRHPHIVEIIGACMLPPHYQIVLRKEASTAATLLYDQHQHHWQPGWHGALHLGLQLAEAIEYMHSKNTIHRDIKPANLLLDEPTLHLRLADFGIARRLDESDDVVEDWKSAGKPSGGFHKRAMVGTLEYMSPELLHKQRHSPGSDIFAMAVTINELASPGIVPYSDCTRDNPLAHTILEMGYGRQELAVAVAAEGLRPTIAPNPPSPVVVRLLKQCWDADVSRRPSAREVVEKLQGLMARWGPWTGTGGGGTYINGTGTGSEVEEKKERRRMSLDAWPSLANLVDLMDHPPAWVESLLGHPRTSSAATKIKVKVGSFATPGARGEDRMEDRCCIIRSLCGLPDDEGVAVAGVFDGHRGAAAAEYMANSLERHLEKYWTSSTGPDDLLYRALLDADREFRSLHTLHSNTNTNNNNRNAGSTAVVALLMHTHLTVANIGDSRAMLCRNNQAVPLTRDHSADDEEERRRIQSCGGTARHVMGQWRVGEAGLAVTRSIGDEDVKGVGVVAEADLTTIVIRPDIDSFVILGTDGLWDQLSGQQAVDIVMNTVKQPAMCAQRLVTEAVTRGSLDNVTAVVMFIPGGKSETAGTAERVF